MDTGIASDLCIQATLRTGLSGADAGPFEIRSKFMLLVAIDFMYVTPMWA